MIGIMEIESARFIGSSTNLSQTPEDDHPEFAFIGRSNVGKSSLINMLTQKSGLAKVSSTPGKTRLINHFLINEQWYLVDLPGYGYARVSKTEREQFWQMIKEYITKSERMHLLFVLVDARHKPQKNDLDFITLLGEEGIPFGIVFTKSDKLSQREISKNINQYKNTLLKNWAELPPVFITSSEKKRGREEIVEFISHCLEEIEESKEKP